MGRRKETGFTSFSGTPEQEAAAIPAPVSGKRKSPSFMADVAWAFAGSVAGGIVGSLLASGLGLAEGPTWWLQRSASFLGMALLLAAMQPRGHRASSLAASAVATLLFLPLFALVSGHLG